MRTRTYEVVGPVKYDFLMPYRLVYEEGGRKWFVTTPSGPSARFKTVKDAETHRDTLVPRHREVA